MNSFLFVVLLVLSFEVAYSKDFHIKITKAEYNSTFEAFCKGKFEIKKFYSFPKKVENLQLSTKNSFQDRLDCYYTLSHNNQNVSIQSLYLLSYVEFVIPSTVLSISSISLVNTDFTNDPLFSDQWYLKRIGVPKAWEFSSGVGVLIGVIDTGIEENHPDIKKNLWVNSLEDINKNGQIDPYLFSEEINGVFGDFDGIDNDGNGFIDDVIGYDFVDQDLINSGDYALRDGYPQDERGHGTSVTGIISAERNNEIGVAGIAYNSKVMTLRAFDITGNGQDDDVAAAIVYGVFNGVKVLNCSFGDVYKSPLVEDAIQFALENNVVVVVSAGNERASFDRYPSGIDGVISVSATTNLDKSASFSSFGNYTSLAAPGVNILTADWKKGYQYFSGTSASAPIVSSVAALLLEIKPNLKPIEVKSILEESSEDIGEKGWDIFFGAGLVNAENAVQSVSYSTISIEYPILEQIFIREQIDSIPISISTVTPLFEKSELFWGYGNNPNNWNFISNNQKQVRNKTSNYLRISDIKDSIIILRLVVTLKNGRTLENRKKIILVSKNSIKLVDYSIFPSWYGSMQELYVSTEYTIPLHSTVMRKSISNSFYSSNQNILSNTFYHKVGTISSNSIDEITMKAYLPSDSLVFNTSFSTTALNFPERSIQRNIQSLPPGYVCPKVFPMYDTNTTILINDFSSGTWGTLRTYSFENNSFILKDSLSKNWVPRGMGNTNGNKFNEILVQEFGKTILFEQEMENGSPFAKIIFSDTIEQNFWGVALEDIDGDGFDDIIGFNDSALVVKSFKNNTYIDLYIATNPSKGSSFSGRKYVFGNFDADNNKEIAFVDFDGDLSIFEITSNGIQLEYFLERDGIEGTQMIASGDLDGDGIDDIITGFSTSERITTSRKPTTPFWNFHILKSTNNNEYKIMDTVIVSDVRIGGPFNNAISIEKLDSSNSKKMILSLFPYVYVFGFENNKVKPIGLSFSNSSTITSLNDNSFLVNRGDSIVRYSLTTTPFYESPSIYDAFVENQTDATISWIGNVDFSNYSILVVDNENDIVLDSTVTNTTISFTVAPDKQYRSIVSGITSENVTSLPSSTYSFVSTPQIQVKNVKGLTKNTLLVTYSGRINSNNHQPKFYRLSSKIGNINFPISTSNPFSDSSVLVATYNSIKEVEYILSTASFRDYFGNPTIANSSEGTFTFPTEENKPFFMNYSLLNPDNSVTVGFSEKFDVASTLNLNNYSLHPFGSFSSVTIVDSTIIRLFFSDTFTPFASGKTYFISAKYIENFNLSTQIDTSIKVAFIVSSENAENAYFYPNPFSFSSDSKGFFANIPKDAIIEIYTIDGLLKNRLFEKNGNGGIEWDGRSSTNEILTNGLYVFKVISNTNQFPDSGIKKILIK